MKETVAATCVRLADEVAAAGRIAYPLAELNDLLTAAPADEIEKLPAASIADPYRLNYVTAWWKWQPTDSSIGGRVRC
jgi:hypothetical protein